MATLAVVVSTVQLRLTSPVAFGVQSSHSSHDHQPALGHADRELLLVALVPFVKAVNQESGSAPAGPPRGAAGIAREALKSFVKILQHARHEPRERAVES